MSTLFNLIILTSIWVIGLNIVLQPSMALGSVREWAEAQDKMFFKPFLTCIWCMPSFHGLIGYWFGFGLGFAGEFDFKYVLAYPLVVMGSSFVCGFMWSLFVKIDTDPNVHIVDEYKGSNWEENN